ncbi:F420H2 dehydrogenase subunit N [Candidatus Methanoperedens nitroreducens]|uniref:F420H2 dehydrogenase subunit N n=1 Tax=Candidatus Methanoperedens nitratireducens TaxID=1392998 RepID=A0A062V9Y9_9EURY|nr:NADH-quinone oxidoreductase subunit N [Candidatus Methanoperedens nitroreducens]KCZ72534.1 F420H2 dehydrogenase subunit N [Candidatus Methanoperedens nitroreducens]MDJ1423532.1 NADH-quinone oxidoreductase subunit N [Candidatus Methanoperedens sp.]
MSYLLLLPELLLISLALVIVLLGLMISDRSKNLLGYLSAGGLLASIVFILAIKGEGSFFYDAFVVDPLSQIFKLIFAVVSLLAVIASVTYFKGSRNQDEYYALLLLATVGMMVVASANDLVALFVGFELASMATYVLAGFEKRNPASLEAALKYFVIGSLSSALMLFGMSLVYGITGYTSIPGIIEFFTTNPQAATGAINIVAMLFLVAGFAFKMALVPFHMWAPDTYEGSPTVVSALLAAGSKKMGFVAAFKVLVLALVAMRADIQLAFAVLAVVTMTYGNIVAISQRSIKRMLAYSSIAQAGYISLAFVAITPEMSQMAIGGGILLALGHALMKGGAFIAVAVVGYMVLSDNRNVKNTDDLEHFAGLGKRAPITAFAMLVFLLALAGIPPSAGFIGKFVIFYSITVDAVIQASGWMLFIVIVAILNSALSIYYYARVIRYMYVLPPAGERIKEPTPYVVAIVLALIGTIGIGVYPEPFIQMAMDAAKVLGV